LEGSDSSVDYEIEDERAVAIRELHEETNLVIATEDLQLVGVAPTNNLRGRSPDRNFIFTGICQDLSKVQFKA